MSMSIESGAFKSGLQAQQVDPSPSRGDKAHAHPAVVEGSIEKGVPDNPACGPGRPAERLAGGHRGGECDRKLATPFN
ncbi:protein of unknown function [Paraburkholderia dioscoreae]|uniref:Uncharacterized protein n=1 Tax=Paraburkholderia dioscoreae TaxID=2604047 RepID=A0A5Q4ZCA2_9BURK|nr:protein of unknown function [Paraburkholderia dioscoreae]